MKFITVKEGRVELIHNMPFDSQYGLGKTEEQLRQVGVLLEVIPEPEVIEGKIPVPMYNEEQGFYYVYEDVPVPQEIQEAIDAYTLELIEGGLL